MGGRRVFQSRELTRIHRERLLRNGFVQQVMKGWLVSSSPDARDGDSTTWYASFWEFCALYCGQRFGKKWWLSAEQSLLLHAEKTVVPSAVVVETPHGANHSLPLLFGTSLYDLKKSKMPPEEELTLTNGLRLFTPEAALAGYRNEPVYLRNSRYVPPRWEAVRDATPSLFDLLENEPEPGVRAVLGHWLVGYIHPYPDGNGHIARFLMNAMLASGGYPWTVVRFEDRAAYLAALDRASVEADIRPFAEFIAACVKGAMGKTL